MLQADGMLDLACILRETPNNNAKARVVLKPLQALNANPLPNSVIDDGVVWYSAGLVWCNVDTTSMIFGNSILGKKLTMLGKNGIHGFPYGYCFVALPKQIVGMPSYTTQYIACEGRLHYYIRENKLVFCKWLKDGNIFKAVPCTYDSECSNGMIEGTKLMFKLMTESSVAKVFTDYFDRGNISTCGSLKPIMINADSVVMPSFAVEWNEEHTSLIKVQVNTVNLEPQVLLEDQVVQNQTLYDLSNSSKQLIVAQGMQEKSHFEPTSFASVLNEHIRTAEDIKKEFQKYLQEQYMLTFEYNFAIDEISTRLCAMWDINTTGFYNNDVGSLIFLKAVRMLDTSYLLEDEEKQFRYELELLEHGITTQTMLTVWSTEKCTDKESMLQSYVISHRKQIYLWVLQYALHLDCDLVEIYNSCERKGISFDKILKTNLYALGVLFDVSLRDLDRLAIALNKFTKLYTDTARIAVLVDSFMTSNDFMHSSTVCTVADCQAKLITKIKGDFYKQAITDIWGNLETYFKIVPSKLPNFVDVDTALYYYLTLGMGTKVQKRGTDFLISSRILRETYFIYNNLYERSLQTVAPPYMVTDELLAQFVPVYEKMQDEDFKLEPKQINAIKLLNEYTGAIVASAGRGKTTVVKAIIQYILGRNIAKEEEILCLAPTGRSRMRLIELTGFADCYTIHSACGLTPEDKKTYSKSNFLNKKVVIVDESSMIDHDLMYILLRSIPLTCRVYFVADIAQLPPIGLGKPLADMLDYIPIYTLTQSKRALGAINLNANYMLDTIQVPALQQAPDFRMLHVNVQDIGTKIVDICKHHLYTPNETGYIDFENQGLNPSDIQVITPVKSTKFSWGSNNLNSLLQNVFNPINNQKMLYFTEPECISSIRQNDRVVHTVNDYTAQHYSLKYAGNGIAQFHMLDKKGVMNGDIGYVVDILTSDELDIANNVVLQNQIYIVVCYNTYVGLITEKTYVLYSVPQKRDMQSTRRYQTAFHSVTGFELGYALTVHKMQGSQAKLVIGVVECVGGRPDFVSNNTIYTMMTRAEKGVYLVGSILGSNSALNRARKISALTCRTSLFDLNT